VSRPEEKSIAESKTLSIEDFSYEIDPDLIAQEPAAERSASRLMVLHRGSKEIEHKHFSNLPEYLREGDVLVVNDTRVIPCRIMVRKQTGALIEILLLKPEATQPGVWQAMANPLRKLRAGDILNVEADSGKEYQLKVHGFSNAPDSQRRVLVDFGSNSEVFSLLSQIGRTPLPPYIMRQPNQSAQQTTNDLDRYQTIYANAPGAVAAPTAGLHFTEEIFAELKNKGVQIQYLTLHVGPGTFKPISSSVDDHTVESEEFQISKDAADAINKCRAKGGRVFAVGTTSCRSLETAGASGSLEAVESESTSLYIKPGHKFSMVDALITNFHLSRSSLLVLVSAFGGHDFIMRAYHQAIEQRYRFYSYGDAMLIL
jgi:S-adenosylmethionine:tRNA ribosyltransferase-isomerase